MHNESDISHYDNHKTNDKNNNENLCGSIIELCHKNHSFDTLMHVIRTAELAKNTKIPGVDSDVIYNIALMHDLVEDTNVTFSDICNLCKSDAHFTDIIAALWLLTRHNDKTYSEYIDSIAISNNAYAIAVKLADLIDHLSQKSTLSQSLESRYFNALIRLVMSKTTQKTI